MSLKCQTQFPAPTRKREPSDNVASLWGKILRGSGIQEKNALNNLLEKSKQHKRNKKETCAPTLHQHRKEFAYLLHNANAATAHRLNATQQRPGSVSVTESSLLSKKTRSESYVPGEALS